MVNRGDGGARRPAPPPGRPAPRPRPAADEDEEKTNAINLADMNLDDLDEAPMPSAAPPTTRPSPKKPAARAPVEEEEEKTSALNLAEIDLDALDAAPPARPQPAARPAPGRATPAQPPAARPPAARPQPTRPKPRGAPVAEEEEKTSALNLDEVERAMRQPSPAPARPAPKPLAEEEEKTSALNLNDIDLDAIAPSPAKRGGGTIPRPVSSKPAAPAPVPRPAPRKEPAEPVVEKTMAVSLDEFEAHRPSLSKGRGEAPKSADATFLVDEEEVPVVKAPPPKRLGASKPEAPAPAASADAEPTLAVRAGPDAGKTFPLTKDLTLVGRGLDADVVINDASASRKHFNVVRTLSGWKLVDLGSGNGTRVDGTRVTEIALQNGMRIEAGGTTLEWVMSASPRAASAEPAGRGPTGISPAMEEERPARRVAENKPEIRRRDPARLDKFDDKDEVGKAKGGAAPAEEVVEKTTFGDIQALEIDPEWEARRLKQRREGVAETAAAEVEEEVEEPTKSGSGVGKKLAIAGIIVGVLGGGFVAADKFGGLGIIFPKEVQVGKPDPDEDKTAEDKDKTGEDNDKAGEDNDKTAEDKDKAGEDKDKAGEDKDKAGEDKTAGVGGDNPKEAAKAKVAEAEKAAKEGRILAARVLYLEALKLDDLVDGGDSGLVTVENAIKAFGKLNESVKAMGEQRWTDALTSATGIEEGAPNHGLAQELAEIAEEGAVVEQLAKAADLFAKKELDGAKAAVEKALEYARDKYPEGQGFRDAIARAAAPDADLTELDPSDPNAANPPKAQPSDLKPGLDAYAKGDFQGVVNAFDAIVYGGTASRADVAKAKAWSAAATIFDEAMKQVAANPDKPMEQLNYLRAARRADAIMGGSQKERLSTELGKVYGVLARLNMDDKKVAKAGLLARVALTFDANAGDAKAVQAEAAKEAKAWVAEAKGIEGDPDKAAEMFARALRVLPGDDPDYAEADKALEKLLATPEQ